MAGREAGRLPTGNLSRCFKCPERVSGTPDSEAGVCGWVTSDTLPDVLWVSVKEESLGPKNPPWCPAGQMVPGTKRPHQSYRWISRSIQLT